MAMGPQQANVDAVSEFQSLVATGGVVFVAGSGIARLISGDDVATWKGFLRAAMRYVARRGITLPHTSFEAAEACIERGQADALSALYGEIAAALGPGELERLFRETLGGLPVGRADVARALAALNSPIATTNFDTLIERATGLETITWDAFEAARDVLSGRIRGVVHLHGVFNNVKDVVMSEEGYRRLLDDPRAQALLHAVRTMKALVFVGFGAGLSDPTFTALWAWAEQHLAGTAVRVYRLVREDDVDAVRAEHASSTQHVIVLPYGRTYEDLVPFLRRLAPPQPVTEDSWRYRLLKLAAVVLALAVTFGLVASPFSPSSPSPSPPFQVAITVVDGQRPIKHARVSLSPGVENIADAYGRTAFELSAGDAVSDIYVALENEVFSFRLEPSVSAASSITLDLATGSSRQRLR
jgi:hypothetical protein